MGKLSKISAIVFAASMMLGAPAFAVTLDDAIQSALSLSQDKQFGQALRVLGDVEATDKQEFDYRFTRARILTWSGNYDLAEPEYVSLLRDFPNNPDVMVSFGYMEFFRGNLSSAESYFNKVLATHPTYLDAYDGLQRTYELRNSTKEVSLSSLDAAVSCSKGYELSPNGACIVKS